jgi:N-sulfoglucosamine sulfohydrolase
MRRYILNRGWLLLCAVLMAATIHGATVPRPNIVLIIADDMAWEDCGAYGHKTVKTPNLDRMAREGMRFDRAFLTCSSCSPSRSSMITGRYPHSTGAEQLHWPLPKEQVTFVELLKRAGYWTAAAGKWHLGEAVKDRFDMVREANPAGYQLATGTNAARSKMSASENNEVQSGCDQWIPTLRARPRDQPFFLWFAALDPHRDYEENAVPNPHQPGDVVVPPFLPDHPDVRKDLALYYDEINRLDAYVGRVMAELKAQGVDDNTLVLFTSDNGRAFPRCKTTVYDTGIKTPVIVRWPGQVKAGSTCARLISSVDFSETFLELAGLKPTPTFQGRSFAALLKNPEATVREHVFAEHNWHDFEARTRAVRSERFKYIRNDYPDLPNTPPADAVRSLTFMAMRRLRDAGQLTPGQMACFVKPKPAEELYDTQADPFEAQNLAGNSKHAATLDRLRAELARWQKETDDRMPGARTADEFDRETGDPLPNRVRPRVPRPAAGK